MATVIGIDLGTTNSLAAFIDDSGNPRIIDDEQEGKLVPSVISFNDENRPVIGVVAKDNIVENVEKTVYSVKRLMGRSFSDVKTDSKLISYKFIDRDDGLIRVKVGEKDYTPIELSAMILSKLKKRAEQFFDEEITQAVISVPAYFNDSQRQATRDAGRLAGLDVLRIINEPTAASLSYGLAKKEEGIAAVYDLGGGTFDISILKLKGGIFEVLSTNGNTYLGGDDIDKNIMGRLMQKISEETGINFTGDRKAIQQVRKASEEAKILLSSQEIVDIEINFTHPGKRFSTTFSRAELEELALPVIEHTLENCKQALDDAKVKPEHVDAVILVGGMTRMPLVRKIVKELFKQEPKIDINPDEVVALGAAVQGDILSGNKRDMLLLDVNPLSLGIETVGEVVSVLIPRNTTIPTRAQELFTTFVDNQTGVDIHVLQGERDLVKYNRSLGKFQLKGIPPQPAGLPKVQVTFMIDANGILNVSARDLRSGKEATIDIKPSYGLTDEEVEKMLMDSLEHAEEDIKSRMLIEARNEAKVLLKATDKVFTDHREAINDLTADERTLIESGLTKLREMVEGTDTDAIRRLTDDLNEATSKLAKAVMEGSVKKALEQQNVDQIEKKL